jgi:hypothetical protein
LLGTAAGVLFGVSGVAIKARTGAVADSGTVGLLSPRLVPCALASVIAFYASARGLQKGDAVSPSPASPPTSPRSPAAWSSSATPRATLALLLVTVAAALMPGPLRLATA